MSASTSINARRTCIYPSPPLNPSARLVKTRRAPSRHSRDARVHGRTTTAMQKLSTPPPSKPPRPPLTGHTTRLHTYEINWCIHSRQLPPPSKTGFKIYVHRLINITLLTLVQASCRRKKKSPTYILDEDTPSNMRDRSITHILQI